jgi:hypothetical protein
MGVSRRLVLIGLALTGAGAAGVAAQPVGPGGGMMSGQGRGPMGPGMMGRGGQRQYYGDVGGYLEGLKAELAIKPDQETAWSAYAEAVQSAARDMQAAHKTMYEAMGTATWEERRNMVNGMLKTRQQSFDTVHAAAEKLLPELTPEQRSKAERRLPGLAGPARGMRGQQMGPGSRPPYRGAEPGR